MTQKEKKEIFRILKKEERKYFQLSDEAINKHDYKKNDEYWAKYQAIAEITIKLIEEGWVKYEET